MIGGKFTYGLFGLKGKLFGVIPTDFWIAAWEATEWEGVVFLDVYTTGQINIGYEKTERTIKCTSSR